jgi:hypothetical protein
MTEIQNQLKCESALVHYFFHIGPRFLAILLYKCIIYTNNLRTWMYIIDYTTLS